MDRVVCKKCNSWFFGNKDCDFINGEYYCDCCQEYLAYCSVCDEVKEMKVKKVYKLNKYENGYICQSCKEHHLGFASLWLIMRFKTFKKDSFTCRYCGSSPLKDVSVKLHCDHIVPLVAEGKTEMSNLITACEDCNMGKSGWAMSEEQAESIKNRRLKIGNCI
ncbi:hypothetical protein LCGC14_1975910 [marine sediment metagenome]|uniref:HNH nuclease domain-containing protein n=1 Tax=marine sediment metagenome TaxID=412755 RepID=A0A0F9FYK1_9ZZZZ